MSGDSWTETPWSWFGSELRFGTSEGSIRVREESRGPRGRARCSVSGSEYDLRRLVARPAAVSGHVSLEALESVQREAELSERAGKHPNIVRCHGILVQNVGAAHCKLLLCEPCASDLSQHVASKGGTLLAGELADLGQQLAMGLSHLHSFGMLYGSLAASGVLRGSLDGLWKLGDFSRAAALPVAASEWRSRSGAKPCEAPPEARGGTDDALKPEADVWLLASLVLATLCAAKPGDAFFALAPERLLDSAVARLWLLLQWLLAEAPEARPSAGEAAALLGTAMLTPPEELLEEMPRPERRRCAGAALAAARQHAAEAAAAEGNSPSKLADLPLERLRHFAAPQVDQILENCGVDGDGAGCAEETPRQLAGGHSKLPPGFCKTSFSRDVADVSTNASGMSEESSRFEAEGKMADDPACQASFDLLGLQSASALQ